MTQPARLPAEVFLDRDFYTEDEYFAWDEQAPGRWEFVPDGPPDVLGRHMGTIRAMSGGTPSHGKVAGNLITALNIALRQSGNRSCSVYPSDVKVHCADDRNTYPDVSVVCGPPALYRKRRDVITNPILVAEVLSPSTAALDRGAKWDSYRTIPSLQHYVILAADRPHVEVYTRQDAGWLLQDHDGPDAPLALSALGVTLSLADLYDLINFDADE